MLPDLVSLLLSHGLQQVTLYSHALCPVVLTLEPGIAQLFVGGTLADLVGRLWALRISISVMIIGVIVQVVPNTYAVLIVGRLITGLGFGCVYIASSLYVAETSPRTLRGSFVGTVTQFGYVISL